MKRFLIIIPLMLSACNAVNIKPQSLDKSGLIYADRGGYTMKFAIKQELEQRGYKVIVGKAKSDIGNTEFTDIVSSDPMNARYMVRVSEDNDIWLDPLCMLTFQGAEWWRFNVSIADQKTGEELLAWTSRGCSRPAIRRFRSLMSELEKE